VVVLGVVAVVVGGVGGVELEESAGEDTMLLGAKRAAPCSVTTLRAGWSEQFSTRGPVVPPPATTGPAGEAMIRMSGSTSSFTKGRFKFSDGSERTSPRDQGPSTTST
jgi:hypothetical protein